jgi:hypothetical protein
MTHLLNLRTGTRHVAERPARGGDRPRSCMPATPDRPICLSDPAFDAILQRLDLSGLDNAWRDILNIAARNAWSCRDFFSHIVAFIALGLPPDTTQVLLGTPADLREGEGRRAETLILTVRQKANAPSTRPSSAAERWAIYVLRGCDSDHDPKTLAEWARLARISYSGLCESCRLMRVQPKLARDFTRVLRIVLSAPATFDTFSGLFDVSDRRTRNGLLERAGVASPWPPGRAPALNDYLRRQKFVPTDNCGLLALRALIGARNVA